MFVRDRASARRFFTETWRKRASSLPMDPLETVVAEVIARHPEYHGLIEAPETAIESEFAPERGEGNPFLHMGMHVAIEEQLATDRPPGIVAAYRRLLPQFPSSHELDHRLMECLGQVLWAAQRANLVPDDQAYLQCVARIGRTGGWRKRQS